MASREHSSTPECREIVERLDGDTETRVYSINTPNPEDAAGDIGLPKKGDRHPVRKNMYAIERRIKRATPGLCEAVITYSTIGRDWGDTQQDEEEYEIGAKEETMYYDLDNQRVAPDEDGVPRGISIYRPHEIESVIVWRSFFHKAAVRRCVAKLNDSRFMDCNPGQLLYLGAVARRVGSGKWQIMHKFMYAERGHQPTSPEIEVTESKTEEDIVYITTGQKVDSETGVLKWKVYRAYEKVNFNQLGML